MGILNYRKLKGKLKGHTELIGRIVIIVFLIFLSQTATTELKKPSVLSVKKKIEQQLEKPHIQNMFGVKFKDHVPFERVREINAQFNTASTKSPNWLNKKGHVQVVKTQNEKELKNKMLEYSLDPDVEFVEVAQIGEFTWTDSGPKTYSDDFDQTPAPSTGRHWYFDKTNLPEVWDDNNCVGNGGSSPCGGQSSIVVAILDSGVAYQNYSSNYEAWGTGYTTAFAIAPELNGINLWSNPDGETEAVNNDADGNGICDDEYGVDFGMWIENLYDTWNCATRTDSQKEGHPNDDYGHGTFVTGIIASLTDNSTGSIGSAHNVSIMSLKTSYPFSGPNSLSFYYATVYAVDYGADIIQVSSGWSNSDSWLSAAADYAFDNDVLMVVSSGNGYGNGIDYPAQYGNTMAIGAIDADDSRSNYSDYGSRLDMVAPVGDGSGEGTAAYQQSFSCAASTCTSSSDFTSFSYLYSTGTSFAAPQVSAAASLMKSKYANLSRTELLYTLKGTAAGIGSINASGRLDLENLMKNTWSPWKENGSTPGNITLTTFNPGGGTRLYQAVRGIDNKIYTRYSLNGSSWTSWAAKGSTPGEVTMVSFDPGGGSRLYQAVRGIDSKIYTRYSTDGGNWSSWAAKGSTSGEVSMSVFNPGGGDRLYQAVRGVDGKIYTRYSSNGSSWSSWAAKGSTPSNITMIVFDPGSGDRLYQAVRGVNSKIYTRYSSNGSSWTSWAAKGSTPGEIEMEVFNPGGGERLYQAVRGVNNNIYTRNTSNGSSWSSWSANGKTYHKITMEVFDQGEGDKLYQAVHGTDDKVYTRYSSNGTSWSGWIKSNEIGNILSMDTFNPGSGNKLYQAMADGSSKINTRYLDQL